jgi:PilZ domain-containing protein
VGQLPSAMWKFLLGKKGSPERQPRVEAEISVNFRKVSDFSWSIGRIRNISRSGALFRAVQRLGPSTPIEMEFVAPSHFGDDAGQLVACRGKIVRFSPPPPDDRRAIMAVHFSKLAVVRRPGEW